MSTIPSDNATGPRSSCRRLIKRRQCESCYWRCSNGRYLESQRTAARADDQGNDTRADNQHKYARPDIISEDGAKQ
jgi:hypothetical protein